METNLTMNNVSYPIQLSLDTNSSEKTIDTLQASIVETPNKVAAATQSTIDNFSDYLPAGKRAKVLVVYSQSAPAATNTLAENPHLPLEERIQKRTLGGNENSEPETLRQKRIRVSPELSAPAVFSNNSQPDINSASLISIEQEGLPKEFSTMFPIFTASKTIKLYLKITEQNLIRLLKENKIELKKIDEIGNSETVTPATISIGSTIDKEQSQLCLRVVKEKVSRGDFFYSVVINRVSIVQDMLLLRNSHTIFLLLEKGCKHLTTKSKQLKKRGKLYQKASWWKNFNHYRKTVQPQFIDNNIILFAKHTTTQSNNATYDSPTQQAVNLPSPSNSTSSSLANKTNEDSLTHTIFLQQILKTLDSVDETIGALNKRITIIDNTITSMRKQITASKTQ